jgi:hypothetical protein
LDYLWKEFAADGSRSVGIGFPILMVARS